MFNRHRNYRKYTAEEDSNIIKYILLKKPFHKLQKLELYADMAKEIKSKRTPEALRKRLLTHIIPFINFGSKSDRYSFLTSEEILLFQNGVNSQTTLDQYVGNVKDSCKENIEATTSVNVNRDQYSKNPENVDRTVSDEENYDSDDSMSTNATFSSTVNDRVNTDFDAIENYESCDNVSTRPMHSVSGYSIWKPSVSQRSEHFDSKTFCTDATIGSTLGNLSEYNPKSTVSITSNESMQVQLDIKEGSLTTANEDYKSYTSRLDLNNTLTTSENIENLNDVTTNKRKRFIESFRENQKKQQPTEPNIISQSKKLPNLNTSENIILDDNCSTNTTYYSIPDQEKDNFIKPTCARSTINSGEKFIYCIFCGSKIKFPKTLTIVNCVLCKKIFSLTFKRDVLTEISVIA